MDLRRILGADLYERAKRFADKKFGSRKLSLLVRMSVLEDLEKDGA